MPWLVVRGICSEIVLQNLSQKKVQYHIHQSQHGEPSPVCCACVCCTTTCRHLMPFVARCHKDNTRSVTTKNVQRANWTYLAAAVLLCLPLLCDSVTEKERHPLLL